MELRKTHTVATELQSGQFGFLGGTATWLDAGVSGEIPAYGDVLTMNATRAASVHRRFLFCYAEVLANCNEETSRCSRRLLQVLRRRLAGHDGQLITSEQFSYGCEQHKVVP